MTLEAIAAEKLPVKGPVEILCEEIGHPYDASLARVDVFVAFVEVLVAEISDMIAWRSVISRGFKEDGFNTLEAMKPLKAVQSLVKDSYTLNADEREERCAELHNGICDQPDDGPCNRFIEMLSSCVSALRFGLEIPCRSRHAAEASNHIWKHKYGVTLFDEHTTRWQNDWAVSKFKQALELRGICYRPAIAQAIKDAIAEATGWMPIATLPDSDDLVWLMRRDEIKGPCHPHAINGGFVAHDGWDYWAPCVPPTTGRGSMIGLAVA